MGWLFHRNYVGPDRRSGRFQIRFVERRKASAEPHTSFHGMLSALFARGLKWVDAMAYFGPDRRSGAFSHFILERRRHEYAGAPPPLRSALRQLRVRVLEADDENSRSTLQERLTATALLADAQGQIDVSLRLMQLATKLKTADCDVEFLSSALLEAEAALDGPTAERTAVSGRR